jgi:hypothetical protein
MTHSRIYSWATSHKAAKQHVFTFSQEMDDDAHNLFYQNAQKIMMHSRIYYWATSHKAAKLMEDR